MSVFSEENPIAELAAKLHRRGVEEVMAEGLLYINMKQGEASLGVSLYMIQNETRQGFPRTMSLPDATRNKVRVPWALGKVFTWSKFLGNVKMAICNMQYAICAESWCVNYQNSNFQHQRRRAKKRPLIMLDCSVLFCFSSFCFLIQKMHFVLLL